ncbi:MAG: YciK family oxidoreductase [Gammaproteobacteria bacterium]|nr:YciK family oxidoreductase [Gammaproteobacteria bacterium]
MRHHQPAPGELAGRVVAVTGAGQGIGRAVALAAAAQGAEVVLIGRTIQRLENTHADIEARGGRATIAPLDLEKALAGDYDRLAAAVQERYGRLDGLLHNAAMLGTVTPIEHYDVPTWVRVLHVNVTAAMALTQVLLPLLRAARDPTVVFTSSGVTQHPGAFWGAYAASKHAIEGLALTLAAELADATPPVRVNLINPGPTRTRMRRQAFPAEDSARLAPPESRVNSYLWLLGPASGRLTGQRLDCQ